MMSQNLKSLVVRAAVIGLLGGLAITFVEFQLSNSRIDSSPNNFSQFNQSVTSIRSEESYIGLTRDQMINQADIIFVGTVTKVSHTRWNQDSGEYWSPDVNANNGLFPIQLHYIELAIAQPIIDEVGVAKEGHVVVTVPGLSPLDSSIDNPTDHDLKIGDQAVVFARQTEFVWMNGTRTILELMGYPRDSYFKYGDDKLYHGRPDEQPVSLNQLTQQIAQKRTLLIQPRTP